MIENLLFDRQTIPAAAADAMTVLAPSAAWGFLSAAAPGNGNEVYVAGGTADRNWHLRHLRAECPHVEGFRQRIGEPASSVAPFAYGLLVSVADDRRRYGVVSLLRTAAQGPFVSDERTTLERNVTTVAEWFALDEQLGSDGPSEDADVPRGSPTVFIVDRDDMRIESAAQSYADYDELQRAFLLPVDGMLAAPLARAVRGLTAHWGSSATECPAAIAHPIPSLAVRVVPMLAGGHVRVCVLVEPIERRSLLARAAERFSLSARELDVLELLLAGESTPSVATMLSIAEPTARDHIKRLLSKTGARNRVEIASRFFGFRPRTDATRVRRRSA
jgi:DNA-binding CsgD family transcriptional regulator